MSEDDEILAGEYVLGTLHADERTVFASVLTHDRAMRELVEAWQNRLAPLCAAVEETPPPADVWERIEATLDANPSRPFTAIKRGRAGTQAQVFATIERGRFDMQAALRRSRNRWRSLAAVATALAATLAIFIADREFLRPGAVQPSYVAVVNRGGDEPALIVRVDLGSGQVFVRPVATETPAGKSLELWYIGTGKAPKSMGLIDKGPVRLPLPAGVTLDKATFAVTVEPQGGSPTGGPTGPIVYSGQLIKQ